MAEKKKTSPAKRRRPTKPTPKPKVVKPPKDGPKVDPATVVLKPGNGPEGKGGGPSGEYWIVEFDGRRAGEVFVNLIDEPPLGRHASLQIFLNVDCQGKGIGRAAYRQAAEASQHRPLYLHMRKSNHASRLAAEAAGFKDVTTPDVPQLIMRWDGS